MSELEKIKFDFIRYANCWEDADLLAKGLQISPGEKVVSICSAGDNSFYLLKFNPEIVVAADINPVQLYLAQLKKTAIKNLEREEFLEFSGFRNSSNRIKTFNSLSSSLDNDTRSYWEKHIKGIENGICHYGKFEKYFRTFSGKILPLIHTKKRVEELFREKSAEEQQEFYNKKWNNLRWKLLFKIFFSRLVMGRLGRDPKFMNEVKVSVGTYIFNKAEQHLQSVNAQTNFMLRYQLTGSFGDLLPDYLLEENYSAIKNNIDRIVFRQGYIESTFNEFGAFDAMNLSDIFEYLTEDTFADLGNTIIENLNRNGRVAYWNLMVPRNLAKMFPCEVSDEKKRLKDDLNNDRGFFYKEFIVNQKLN